MSKTSMIRNLSKFIPNPGTILVVVLVLASYRVWAAPAGPSGALGLSNTISYQGTLTDSAGQPVNTSVDMTFRLYNVETGGTALWEEAHTSVNAVPVQSGLFHVLLGSLVSIPADVWSQTQLYLGIQIASDAEMAPREVVGLLPAAYVAQTVPDGSITTAKLNIDAAVVFNGHSIANLNGIELPFELKNDRPWEFTFYGTGSDTRTALHSLTNNKSFLFTSNDDTVVLSIQADNGGGYLDMNGHAIINVGAIVEANLQTPEQLTATTIAGFNQGDVLCWDGAAQQLSLCGQFASPLVVAVANEMGKPITLGVEGINVLGPIQAGDLLVSSDQPGYAVAWSAAAGGELPPGVVIAKALASCAEKETCQIKALITTR